MYKEIIYLNETQHYLLRWFCDFKKNLTVQLRDPKNDFIFNFNFDDKMKIFEQFEFGTK